MKKSGGNRSSQRWRVPLAVLMVLLVLISTLRAFLALARLQEDARSLQLLRPESILGDESTNAETLLAQTSADLNELRSGIGPLIYVLPAMGWVPRYGGDLENAPGLLDFADQVILSARDTMSLGRTILSDPEKGESNQVPIGVAILRSAETEEDRIQRVRGSLQKVSETRKRIDAASLSTSLQETMYQFDGWLPVWQMGIDTLANAPALLGGDRPRTFLLIAQNSDELRATGGFLSGVALVRVDQGKISVGEFQDSPAVDNLKLVHPKAPEPLLKYMYAWQWMFRDGNWSPDLPTAARQLISMYQYDRGIKPDGVIAVDLKALPAFLQAMGSVSVDGYSDRIDATNVGSKIEAYWTAPLFTAIGEDWYSHRKDFIADLLKTLMARLLNDEFDRGQLARGLVDVVLSKDLWVYLDGETGASPVVLPPGGALYHGAGDALMLVDSNVGFNKVDDSVSREIDYSVMLDSSGTLQAAATITYTNLSPSNDSFCVHQPHYLGTYAELRQACYWDYVRLVVPNGAELLSATGLADVTRDMSEKGRTVFGGYLVVPRGETRRVRMTYRLPQVLQDGMLYSLHLERQPGAPEIPVTVHVEWPEEWQIKSAGPEPAQQTEGGVEFAIDLNRDTLVRVALDEKTSPMIPAIRIGLIVLAAFGILLLKRGLRRRNH